MNWYEYCNNNPIRFIDPSGTSPLSDVFMATAAAVSNVYKHFTEAKAANNVPFNRASTVVESDNKVEIYSYVKFINKGFDDIVPGDDTKWREAAIAGIKEGWEGKFAGKKVTVSIIDLSDGKDYYVKENQTFVSINFSASLKANATPTTMNLTCSYKVEQFKWTSAHEYGHVLGLSDVYDDDGITSRSKFPSLMNYENAKGVMGKAQPVDYAVLIANKTWLPGKFPFKYSYDKETVKDYFEDAFN